MSEQQQGPPEDLDALVAEHPEEVARLLENLGLVNDLLDATAVATAGLDDDTVEELTATGTDLAAAADGMATPATARLGSAVGEHADSLADGLETVVRLEESGTLDDLAELAAVASLLTAALDDGMVERLAATGTRLGEVADTAADEDVARGLDATLTAFGEASETDPEPVGTLGLVRALRDPEVQAGLGVVLALSRSLGRELGAEE